MTLSGNIELARDLFGRDRDRGGLTRVTGTATADSADGTVTIELDDGDVIEAGAIGAVSAGQTVTVHIQRGEAQVIAAEGWGDSMQAAVDEAAAVAEATGQHFWTDTNGAHVTEVTREEWEDSTGPTYHFGHNALFNSLGMLFRRALDNLVSITSGSVAFYDGQGNDATNVTASFGSTGAVIGRDGSARMVVSQGRISGVNPDGVPFLDIDYEGSVRTAPARAIVSPEWHLDGQPESLSVDVSGVMAGTTIQTDGRRFRVSVAGDFSAVSVMSATGCYASIINPGYVEVSPFHVEFAAGTAGSQTARVEVQTQTGSWVLVLTVSHDGSSGVVFAATATGAPLDVEVSTLLFWTVATTAPLLTFGTRSDTGASSEDYTVTLGEGLAVADDNQTAVGRYNYPKSNALLTVGNGSDDAHRSNALAVEDDGDVTVGGGLSLFGGTAFEDMFSVANVSTTIGAVSASSTKTLTISAARTGYKPIAVSGWYVNGAAQLHPYMLRLNGTNVQAYLRNNTNGATSASATIDVQVLYVKTA